MGCPVNTVKTRLFHARAKLQKLLPLLGGSAPPIERGGAT
jgi:DNA-directed RNA polymerase specialized sigma24 family protein